MELSFIHTADVHLCRNFDNISISPKERELRRRELWEVFERIIDLSMENEADYLFIAGDLICSKYAKLKDYQKISEKLNALQKTKIIIAAGNNDPLNEASYYNIIDWPPNVYIIKEKTRLQKIEIEEDNLCLYGASIDDLDSNFKINEILDVEIDESKINILVLHGGHKNETHPLYIDFKKLDKFDYCALGHVHDHNEIKEHIVYPGTPEPLDYSEEGKRGVLMGKVGKNIIFKIFIPLSKRKFITKEVYLQKDYSKEKILDIIKYSGNIDSLSKDYYRIILHGELNKDIRINMIKQEAEKYFRHVEFIENFNYDLDLKKIQKENENNLIGRYINEIAKMTVKPLELQKSILMSIEELSKEKVDS
ncbi:MAG: hypothetical protein R6U59_01525 [Eubacteriales bacterium]